MNIPKLMTLLGIPAQHQAIFEQILNAPDSKQRTEALEALNKITRMTLTVDDLRRAGIPA